MHLREILYRRAGPTVNEGIQSTTEIRALEGDVPYEYGRSYAPLRHGIGIMFGILSLSLRLA